MATKSRTKKEKSKISKLIEKSDSEIDENEHELSFYMNDRVKLMKEVLKIIKPKKIKSMAPDCIKDLDIEEINSMLLEELLGISNKRLKYIFNGQNLGEDSSSTDPEEEKQPVDIISLDDVSDDDFVIEVDGDSSKMKKSVKVKEEPKSKKVKKEKSDKKNSKRKDGPLEEENLMSVLELLELQARARAIRSQLMLEASKKNTQPEVKIDEGSDTDDAVIIESPKNEEIVINSSDSDSEQQNDKTVIDESGPSRKKITLIRDRGDTKTCEATTVNKETENNTKSGEESIATANEASSKKIEETESCDKKEESKEAEQTNDEDEIILIVDQEEMDRIIGD